VVGQVLNLPGCDTLYWQVENLPYTFSQQPSSLPNHTGEKGVADCRSRQQFFWWRIM